MYCLGFEPTPEYKPFTTFYYKEYQNSWGELPAQMCAKLNEWHREEFERENGYYWKHSCTGCVEFTKNADNQFRYFGDKFVYSFKLDQFGDLRYASQFLSFQDGRRCEVRGVREGEAKPLHWMGFYEHLQDSYYYDRLVQGYPH